jgi:rhamnogalacturonyl hydrolase YesR
MLDAAYVRVMVYENLAEPDAVAISEVFVGDSVSAEVFAGEMGPIDWGDITQPAIILEMLDAAYQWQIVRPSTHTQGGTRSWVSGAFFVGVYQLYDYTRTQSYYDAMVAMGESHTWKVGDRSYHADDHCIGQTYLDLFLENPAENPTLWYSDLKTKFDTVLANPPDYRAQQLGTRTTTWWSWCDALFMAPAAWAQMSLATGDSRYVDYMDELWWNGTVGNFDGNPDNDYLYSEAYQLFYRDTSWISKTEPNGQPSFWSRGNGWVIAGLARVLQYLPSDHPSRSQYLELFDDMCAALAAIQSSDGLWRSSLLYPEGYSEPELSGSAFFTYAMAWGVNQGILAEETYGAVIQSAWEGLSHALTASGKLKWIQPIGAGPASNIATDDYTDYNRHYGYGAFLMAGVEMARYFESHSPESTIAMVSGVTDPESPVADYRDHYGSYILDQAPAAASIGAEMGWSRVEDFEGSTPSWVTRNALTGGAGSAQIIEDPWANSSNHVLAVNAGTVLGNHFSISLPIGPVLGTGTVTVYQRIGIEHSFLDVTWGLSDVVNPTAYADYEVVLRSSQVGKWEAYDGSGYTVIAPVLQQPKTWYELWLVVRNSEDRFDVYLRGGTQYSEPVLLAQNVQFRNGGSADLVSYFVVINNGTASIPKGTGSLYIDDLYMDSTGVNLTTPVAGQIPSYSIWGNMPYISEDYFFRETALGTVFDGFAPYFYAYSQSAWYWVHPSSVRSRGMYLWSYTEASWFWYSDQWQEWMYDFTAQEWRHISVF